MPALHRATRALDDGCPRRWSFRQVGPPYPPEDMKGGLEAVEPRVRPMQAVVPPADAATVTILRVEGLRPFASTTWLSRVLAAPGPGPVVLEVLSLALQGDGEDEMRIADQVLGQDPPSLPPSLPVVLLDLAADLGRRAAARGVRVVIFGPVVHEVLRGRLASSVGLLPLLAQWLMRHGGDVDPRAVHMAVRLVGEGMDDPEALAFPAMSGRHERRLLKDAGFPPPGWWSRLGRVLAPILALQRDTSLTVDGAARAYAFTGGVDLADCTRRLLGASPGDMRSMLGWEGVMWKVLTQSRGRDRR